MGFLKKLFGKTEKKELPPTIMVPEMVKEILSFMPDIEMAKNIVAEIQASNKNNIGININGDTTKQGRYMLNIEGNIPKEYALEILQIIKKFNGSIEVVAGE